VDGVRKALYNMLSITGPPTTYSPDLGPYAAHIWGPYTAHIWGPYTAHIWGPNNMALCVMITLGAFFLFRYVDKLISDCD
jgi:hypothetical protein